MKTPKQIAKEFRTRPGMGMIVVYGGEVEGYGTHPTPGNYRPGSVAVDADGNELVAAGGSVIDGAERWDPVAKEKLCQK